MPVSAATAAPGADLRPPLKLLPPLESEQTPTPGAELQPVTDNSYLLGPGDQIQVIDYSGRDLHNQTGTQIVTVQRDGTVSVYPVGVIKATGKTLEELTKEINRAAEKYMVDPQFQVGLFSPRPVTVYVLGDVRNPGVYTLGNTPEPPKVQLQTTAVLTADEGVTQPTPTGGAAAAGADAQSFARTTTLISALEKAGGVRETANVRNVRVTRNGKVINVDLWRLLVEGDASQDIDLEARDTVFVPTASATAAYDPIPLGRLASTHTRTVRVWGAVKRPGLFELSAEDDVLSVIAKAGGFEAAAAKDKVLLSRTNPDGSVSEQKISINEALATKQTVGRTKVQPGDVVVVNFNPLLQARGPVLRGAMTFFGAFMLIYLSNKIRNVNVQSGDNAANSNVRVLAF